MIQIDAQTMREIAPHFSGANGERQNAIITAVGEVLAATLDSYAINTRLRIAHFLGQTCHESAGFRTTEEFASGENYEGRADLGNTMPGDGVRYKGRGLLQLTGRANYKAFGDLLGVKLEGNPELAAEPILSLKIACEFWKKKSLNQLCDSDDVVELTRRINGGKNGLDERRAFTAKAKTAVARIEGFVLAGEAPPTNGQACVTPRLQGRCGRGSAAAVAEARLYGGGRRRFRRRHGGRRRGIPEAAAAGPRRRYRRQRYMDCIGYRTEKR